MALGHEAGLVPEEKLTAVRPRKPRQQPSQRPSNQQRPGAATDGESRPAKEVTPLTSERPDEAADARPRPGEGDTPLSSEPPDAAAYRGPHPEKEDMLPDYHLASVLIQQLPADGKWTKTRRAPWIQAMTSAVDLLVEVVPE